MFYGPYGAQGWPTIGPFGVAIGQAAPRPFSRYVPGGAPPLGPPVIEPSYPFALTLQTPVPFYQSGTSRLYVAATIPTGTVVHTAFDVRPQYSNVTRTAYAFVPVQLPGNATGFMKGLDLAPSLAQPEAYYATPEALARGREILRRRLHARSEAAPNVGALPPSARHAALAARPWGGPWGGYLGAIAPRTSHAAGVFGPRRPPPSPLVQRWQARMMQIQQDPGSTNLREVEELARRLDAQGLTQEAGLLRSEVTQLVTSRWASLPPETQYMLRAGNAGFGRSA